LNITHSVEFYTQSYRETAFVANLCTFKCEISRPQNDNYQVCPSHTNTWPTKIFTLESLKTRNDKWNDPNFHKKPLTIWTNCIFTFRTVSSIGMSSLSTTGIHRILIKRGLNAKRLKSLNFDWVGSQFLEDKLRICESFHVKKLANNYKFFILH